MVFLYTTIPVDKQTKSQLFILKNNLEKVEGRAISYNELVQILLRNMQHTRERKKLGEFRKFRGSLPKDAVRIFEAERLKDLQAEESKNQEEQANVD